MPAYLIVPTDILKAATIAENDTSDPIAAVQAVPPGTPLPTQVSIIPRDSIEELLVVDSGAPTVVVRDEPEEV